MIKRDEPTFLITYFCYLESCIVLLVGGEVRSNDVKNRRSRSLS